MENNEIIFGTDFSTIALEVTQFLQTLIRNSPQLVFLEVSEVDTLFTINTKGQFSLPGTPDEKPRERIKILSKIVSVFAKNVKNRFMPKGLNLTLKHLALQTDSLKVGLYLHNYDIHFCK